VGTIGIFSSKVKGIELTIDNEGKMSGSVDLNTKLDDDVSISDYVKLKKGLNSNFSFSFIAGKDFSGAFDFSKISGINIDILRGTGQKQPVAKITGGSIEKTTDKEGVNDYIFKGTAKLGEKPEFETGGFKAKLNALSVTGELALNSKKFDLKEGSLVLNLQGIPNIKGDVVVSTTYKNYELSALADLSKSSIDVYGLTLSGQLLVELNSEWELSEIVGSNIQASHEKLTSSLTIGTILMKDGALQNIKVTSDINYQGFNFELTNCTYDANADKPISITAKLAIGDNKVEVEKFQIGKEGTFTCEEISTKVTQKFFEFNAGVTIQDDFISGKFNGCF
jgi:hypothetical protein